MQNVPDTLRWCDSYLEVLDQRKLPKEEIYVKCVHYRDIIIAIKDMLVRGAPAIGISGAYGLCLAVINFDKDESIFEKYIYKARDEINKARPTAVNLMWATSRLLKVYEKYKNEKISVIKKYFIDEAKLIEGEDQKANKQIGINGASLIKKDSNILTHCNAGSLATSKYGTALSVIRHAHWDKKNIHVYVDETRPYLQGSRLTSWELLKESIPSTLICDNMAGYLMSLGKVDAVILGADRIAINGDTANKIGTYSLAVLAKYHKIPFYVVAPLSTIDINCFSGENIPIEERGAEEIKYIKGQLICSEEVKVFNPSFDITPNELISAIITEKGILYPPFKLNIKKIFGEIL